MAKNFIYKRYQNPLNKYGCAKILLQTIWLFCIIAILKWLQRETLLRQLETNNLETSATLDELDMRKESEDQNYNL